MTTDGYLSNPSLIEALSSSFKPDSTLSQEDAALIAEAIRLTNNESVSEVIRLALQELVERHRFLKWVDDHECADEHTQERSRRAPLHRDLWSLTGSGTA